MVFGGPSEVAGELRAAQAPLVRDLLRLHDDLGRMRRAAGERGEYLRLVQESLLGTLARNGIEAFAPAPGEPFDSTVHAASGIAPHRRSGARPGRCRGPQGRFRGTPAR